MPLTSIIPPAKNDYVFDGYWDGLDGTGTKYFDKDGNPTKKWNKTVNTILYAKWNAFNESDYAAYVVPHDGTARPLDGSFSYNKGGTGDLKTFTYDGVKIVENGETRYYYRTIGMAINAAQAGQTNTNYATDDPNGVFIKGSGGNQYATGNDSLNPNLANLTDKVVLLKDIVNDDDNKGLWNYGNDHSYNSANGKYGIKKGILIDLNGCKSEGFAAGNIPAGQVLVVTDSKGTGSLEWVDDEGQTGYCTGTVVLYGVYLKDALWAANHHYILMNGVYGADNINKIGKENAQSGGIAAGDIELRGGYFKCDPTNNKFDLKLNSLHVEMRDSRIPGSDDWSQSDYAYRVLKGGVQYKVSFNLNTTDTVYDENGAVYTAPATPLDKTYGTNIELPNNLKRKGYTFKGWATSENALAADYTDSLSSDISNTYGDAKTLYAVWEAHSWVYSMNNGVYEAYCNTLGCDDYAASYEDAKNSGKLFKLTVSVDQPIYDGTAPTIKIGTEEERARWEAAGLPLPTPTTSYAGRNSTTYPTGDTSETTAPTAAGEYTAKVTIGGKITTIDFEIKKAKNAKPSDGSGHGGNGGGNGDSDGDSPATPGNNDNKTPIDFDKIKEDILGEKTPDTTKKPGFKYNKKEETVEESQDVSQEETEENSEEEISKNPNSILEDFKLKDEDAQKLLDSDSPADKKVVDDMLDEAVKRELLQSDDTGRGNPNKDVSTGTIAEKDLRDLAKEVLTDDEIKQMLNGEPVNIGVEVKHNIKDPDYVKIASENKPKGSQIATIFDISVVKQIGDNGDVKVDGVNGTFEVNYLVPEEYRPTDGSMITYQIMRIYTDENGNLCTEIIDVKQDGFMLTYQADSNSKYVLLCNESAPLANVFLKEELKAHKCYIHWLALLVALIGTIVTLISKKRKAKIITAAVEGVLLIILIILGSCVWEYVVTVIGVLATVGAFLLNKKDQDKDEDAKAY